MATTQPFGYGRIVAELDRTLGGSTWSVDGDELCLWKCDFEAVSPTALVDAGPPIFAIACTSGWRSRTRRETSRTRVLDALADDNERLYRCCTWQRSPDSGEASYAVHVGKTSVTRWQEETPDWTGGFFWPVNRYPQIGGWELDDEGGIRYLTSPIAYAVVPSDGTGISGGVLKESCG